MPWCPKCKTEYREGFIRCVDCEVRLTEEKPEGAPITEPVYRFMDGVVIYEAGSTQDAEMICAMLQNADIPAYVQENGWGQVAKAYTGSSRFGSKIIVPRGAVLQARELLAVWAEQDMRAPISEEELAKQAMEAGGEAQLEDNAAYGGAKWIVIALLVITAFVCIWFLK